MPVRRGAAHGRLLFAPGPAGMVPAMAAHSAHSMSFDRRNLSVLLLEGVHPSAVELLAAEGYTQVVTHTKALPPAELAKALAGAHMVGIRSRTQLTKELLAAAPKLMAIGCFCIGTNQVDLAAARRRGIPVFNAPFSNTRSVAELVLAEIIMLLRGIPAKNAAAHRGEWIKSAAGAREARGRTLGIVGYGHIGTQVGVLAEAFGMQVVYHDIVTKLALGNAAAAKSLDALLEAADVVTLHVPETAQTRWMIGKEQLARMKPGTHLVNASRGTVVDIDALTTALANGHLAGAAIDVFPQEPESNDDEFVSPLRRFDNVILTPHVGGSTAEAQQNIGIEVAGKLVRYSDNGSTLTAVNFPEVALPEHASKHRLLHIHENRPGMLSAVNSVFTARRINVAAQFLQTDAEVGYVVIDIDAGDRDDSKALQQELADIPGTIRSRVLY
ncbi:MAG: phosphoglycerate dehydrogenase [Planctomycetes bacterium]|nr:phosphoglycerate dehydrogenase [Planctomycetota bacterium]